MSKWPKKDKDKIWYWEKDPDATGDYSIDWSLWLASAGGAETILSSLWIIPTGITSVLEVFSTTKTMIRLSGGTVDDSYDLVCRITTASYTEDRVIRIKCVSKIGI